jgi:signal transduction histidine kinase
MSEIQGIAFDMKNSATNLFRLLENLLNWARMQKGRITFTPEIMVLLPVVGESVEILREQAKTKKIQIDLDIPDDLEAYADKNIFQTIIRNLVSNAIKFTHRGGNVLISAFRATDREVQISIRDTGIGMDQELVDNLFRIDVKTNRKGTEGELSTGLGLLLCKEFVEKHSGKIWVESKEGKGTVFHLSLPNLST